MFKEISRVTGWGELINHEAFPLLLAAITATNVLWFYPGIARIHASYFPQQHQAATVQATVPMPESTMLAGDENSMELDADLTGEPAQI